VASSILTTVKKSLGLVESDESFDPDIVLFINSVLANLNQIGVGPVDGFQIEDKSATWESFLDADPRLNNVKAFVYLKVKLLFDPPATSFAIQAVESQAQELEYRIYTAMEVSKWQEPVVVVLLTE
jgi:hypothetical protein